MCNTFLFFSFFHLDYPMLRKESFGFIRIIFSLTNLEAVNTISTPNFFWVCFCALTLALFSPFFPYFLEDRFMMFHDVDYLHVYVTLYRLDTLGFSTRVGFIFFVWPLWGALLGIFLEYSTITRGVSGAMHQAYVSLTGRLLAWRD